jgi:DNA mismatch repair protein MutH
LFINKKITSGKTHELSEGDTFYLGACTKGANALSVRKQPFSEIPAKQRAYSFKQGYVIISFYQLPMNREKYMENFSHQ